MRNLNKWFQVATVLFLVWMGLSTMACSSKPKGFELPPAMSEVLRNGELKGLEQADSPILGMPNANDRVTHVCRSQPIYNLDGYYIRTSVLCY